MVYPQDTALTLIKKITKGKYTYYQVRTPEFDGEKDEKYDYYVDSRFIEVSKEKPKDRIPKLPSDIVAGVTWPSILPPGWTVEWDPTSDEEEHEE